ncbi:hypothetical protein Vadar_010087 [Vaccinium darrowii]|uniref:Uncharacterized protein n=1 Tax=Vaccinium darrowii TaxID=229202 RepID=A0ACB7YDW3_9ERIC|nr:hypothetical protein Vadar_010087 [Vaccinium darrowii]
MESKVAPGRTLWQRFQEDMKLVDYVILVLCVSLEISWLVLEKMEDFADEDMQQRYSVQILIGASDWEDHSLGKEGAERYSVHNLPNCSSCSGLHELGIAVPCSCSIGETSKLDPDSIIAVYLGEGENVRTRL